MPLTDAEAAVIPSALRDLITEIESSIGEQHRQPGQEYSLQMEAFRERRQQAVTLGRRMKRARPSEQPLLEGDLYHIELALRCSLAYFRRGEAGGAGGGIRQRAAPFPADVC